MQENQITQTNTINCFQGHCLIQMMFYAIFRRTLLVRLGGNGNRASKADQITGQAEVSTDFLSDKQHFIFSLLGSDMKKKFDLFVLLCLKLKYSVLRMTTSI